MLSHLIKRIAKPAASKARQRIFIPVRFSVLTEEKAWEIAKEESFGDYKANLFAPKRLETKFRLFEDIVIPNLLAVQQQSPIQVQVQVLIAAELPEHYKARLKVLETAYDFLTIHEVARDEPIAGKISEIIEAELKAANTSTTFATVRLDDDDLLSHQYGEKLSKYIAQPFCGHIVSFSKGFEAYIDLTNKKLEPVVRISAPKIALGMAHINHYDGEVQSLVHATPHIYAAGNHTQVQLTHSLILDQAPKMYSRMCYLEQDTQASNIFARIKRNDCTSSSKEEILAEFPELQNLLN